MEMHICPVWMGRLLAGPLRRWIHDPDALLGPYVKEGMRVLDVGSAMGFFSLPMARRVGPNGKVMCLDVQEGMLQGLRKRAERAGLADRIDTRLCLPDSPCLEDMPGAFDFALLFAMVHEVSDPERLFLDVAHALKPGAHVLVAEPKGHVRRNDFEASVVTAERQGFQAAGNPGIGLSHAVLLRRK